MVMVPHKPQRKAFQAYGIKCLLSRHPEIRKLKRLHATSHHGNKVWSSCWLLMDYLKKHPLPKNFKILEIGCGWGLSGIYCNKMFGAHVTAADIDSSVFPYLDLHARVNGAEITTVQIDYGRMEGSDLRAFDLIIGADICFWAAQVKALKSLIHAAADSQTTLLIADPERAPFLKLIHSVRRFDLAVIDSTINRPNRIRGKILEIRMRG